MKNYTIVFTAGCQSHAVFFHKITWNNTIMCSELLITRKKILKYNFILYPSLYQIDRDTKTVYKNKHQQKSMLISKCPKIDQRCDINCRETTICQKTKGQNTKHVQMYTFLCACLYTKVSMQLCLYMVFIRQVL